MAKESNGSDYSITTRTVPDNYITSTLHIAKLQKTNFNDVYECFVSATSSNMSLYVIESSGVDDISIAVRGLY